MTEEIEKSVLGSVRLDSDVWEAVRGMPESLNVYLRRTLMEKKVSKREQVVRERAASDITAQLVGRDDVDYSDTESAPSTHILLDAVGSKTGKASVETFSKSIARREVGATRKIGESRAPLLKPGERKK